MLELHVQVPEDPTGSEYLGLINEDSDKLREMAVKLGIDFTESLDSSNFFIGNMDDARLLMKELKRKHAKKIKKPKKAKKKRESHWLY